MRQVLLILLTLLAGCASAPKYQAPEGIAKNNLSTLYIYRTNVFYHKYNPEKPFFYLDGKEVAKLGVGQSIIVDIIPGKHTLVVKEPFLFLPSWESVRINIDAKPEKEYFIRYSEDLAGLTDGDISIFLVSKDDYLKRK